jgi:excisionase family DNA binding protein
MKLLTVAEAALALNVSEATARKLVARKLIRHERIGLGRGQIRIPEDAVTDYRSSVTVQVQTNGGKGTKPAPAGSPRIKLQNLSLD